jgi:iron complex outermembrane receptor protein
MKSTSPSKISNPKSARNILVSACSAALVSTMVSTGSYAQTSSYALEEVIVTARKRDESLQDTPVAVSALTKELKEASLRRIEDVQDFAPNVYIRRTPGIASGAAISIRGVSSSESDKSFDPAIGVVMDGMFLGTSSGVLLQNFDIKRIEILRGPQGTLFGKNTTGGVLNIIRGDVTMEWGADISATFDEHGREDLKAVVNVPIVDEKLGVKLFAAKIESDGYVRNTTLNEDVGGDDMLNYGFAALWRPNEDFDLKFHYERLNDESDQGAYVNLNQPGELTCDVFQTCEGNTNDGPDRNSADGINDSDNQYDTYIATANYQLGDFLFTYIGTSRDMDEDNNQHFDAASSALLSMRFYNDWEQESHEFRVASSIGENFDFIVGAYLWEVDYEQRWDVAQLHFALDSIGALTGVPGGAGLTPTTLSSNGQVQSTESTAVFAQADWRFAENWTLTFGARWTEEEKDFIGGNSAVFWDPAAGDSVPNSPNDPRPQDGKWDDVTPKIGLSWDANDDIMFYASYTEGFKSGGFFGRQSDFELDVSYEPEFVETFEAGMKSTWLDGRMTFNPVVFYSDYKDKQEQYFVPVDLSNVASLVANAAAMDIFGVELELELQITESWNIRANYGYLDAEYNGFIADLNGDGISTDNDGLTPRNTPENTFGVASTYNWELGDGKLSANVSYHWRDEVESILAPDPSAPTENDLLGSQDSLENLSANLSYAWNDRYRVAAYGRNLTDDRGRAASRIGGLTTRGFWNEGTTIGMEVSASF